MGGKGHEDVVKGLSLLEGWGKSLLLDILAIPTISPEGLNYKELVELVKERLNGRGLRSDVHRVPDEVVRSKGPAEANGNPRYILISRYGKGRPVFHMNCHYDVVPGGPGWTETEPFKPVVRDGRVYARGATDTKGGVVSALMTLVAFSELKDAEGSVEVALVPDEEVGGECGTIYMLDTGLTKPDFSVVVEPSRKENLIVGHKGAVWVEVAMEGKAAHGSTPWLGVNAFEKMVVVAREVQEKLKPLVESRVSAYGYDVPGGERATLLMGGVARAGEKINQVPGTALFTIDRRVLPEEDLKGAEDELLKFIEALGAKARVVNRLSPCVVSPSSPLASVISRSALLEFGFSPAPKVCTGGLDMGFYVSRGFECVTYGPGELGLAHAPNEFVTLDDVYAFSRVFLRTAISLPQTRKSGSVRPEGKHS